MTNTEQVPETDQSNAITRILRVVEWLGNALPHPVTLFALFCIAIILLSGILGAIQNRANKVTG